MISRSDFFEGIRAIDGDFKSTFGVVEPKCYFKYCGKEYRLVGGVDPDDWETIYTVWLCEGFKSDTPLGWQISYGAPIAVFEDFMVGHRYRAWLAKALLDNTE